MKQFSYAMPTQVHFGKGAIEKLPGELKKYGDNILIVTGGGSARKSGLLDEVCGMVRTAGKRYVILEGVKPNPQVGSVREGASLCRKHSIDLVIGLGGGSAVDCAKAIACAACYEGDAWDFMLNSGLINNALPIIAVITLAATGSEINGNFVITNPETRDKIGVLHPCALPAAAILDPEYTYTVPKLQVQAGIADIFSHAFEGYFNPHACYITDGISESVMRTCVKYGRMAVQEPPNYEARANIMWAGSLAMNPITRIGREMQNFITSCHPMEHPLSAFYDVSHGLGLGVLMPAWMRYVLRERTAPRFAEYGRRVFGLSDALPDLVCAELAIERTEAFLKEIGVPLTLWEIGIQEDCAFSAMAEKAAGALYKAFVPLTAQDVEKIYRMCWRQT